MNFLEWIVVILVIVIGLVILYKALKEPLDLIFLGIVTLLGKIRDAIVGKTETAEEIILNYG